MTDPSSAPRRYTLPNQRSRSVNRRQSDRAGSSHGNEGERSQPSSSRNVSAVTDHGYRGTASCRNERSPQNIISLEGCSQSEAYQLLKNRWDEAMRLFNDPTLDYSEKPVMYYRSEVGGKLPQAILAKANKTGPPSPPPEDYRVELRRALLAPKQTSSNL